MAGFFNTLILLGCFQGLIVSSLLFFSKKNRKPNRLLAIMILLISLACFNLYGSYHAWFHSSVLNLIVQLLPLVMIMPLGPLMYFYTRTFLDVDFMLSKKYRRQFYTVFIDLVPPLTVIVFIVGASAGWLKRNPAPWGVFIDDYNVYADIPRWISLSVYSWLSYLRLSAFTKQQHGKSGDISWLNQFIRAFLAFQAVWLLYLIPYVIPRYTDWMLNTFAWYPLYIPMVVLIYWMGIKGYLISQQATDKKTANASSLSPALVQRVLGSLKKTMEEEKLFLNPGLNLAAMAASTGFSQKIISAVLNQHLQKSFNEFVNSYRVQAFTEKILLPEMNHLTIAGIAVECGFNSQATFQRTFKDLTGQSPSAYRKSATLAM